MKTTILLYAFIIYLHYTHYSKVNGESTEPTTSPATEKDEDSKDMESSSAESTDDDERETEMEELLNSSINFKLRSVNKVLKHKDLKPRDKFNLEYLKDKLESAKELKSREAKQNALNEYNFLVESLGLKSLIPNNDDSDSSDDNSDSSDYYFDYNDFIEYLFG